MNNPFQYQNDLSALNTEFDNMNNYYANKVAGAKSNSLIQKGQYLAKQSQDLAASTRKIGSSVEEIVGAAAAKKLVSGVIRPGVEYLTKAAANVGERATEALSNVSGRVGAAVSRLGSGGVPGIGGGGAQVVPIDEEESELADALGDGAGDAAGDAASAASTAAGDAASAVGGAAGDAASALAGVAGDAATALTGAGADAAAAAAAAAASAASVASAAGGVAAADWWNPVGWAAGAIAAGAGIYSGVEAVEDAIAGAKQGAKALAERPGYSPHPSFAGRYVIPVNNAITSF